MQEKVYFIAGPEFGSLAGHTLIINKALYGLRSSGLRFHKKLSSVLCKYGFHRSHVDPDLWMCDAGDLWEYIIVYVDDIIVAMKDAKHFSDELQGPNVGFTMKGMGITSEQISFMMATVPCALVLRHMLNGFAPLLRPCLVNNPNLILLHLTTMITPN